MKVIKIVGVLFLGLLVLMVIISFILPKKIDIETTQEFDVAPGIVYDHINNPKSWNDWSVWNMIDPHMKSFYEGPDSGVGAMHRWESDDSSVGNGSFTIIEVATDESIEVEFDFEGQGNAKAEYLFEHYNDGSRLRSTFHADFSKPMVIGPIMGMIFKGMIKKNTEESWLNLKRIVEALPVYNVEISVVDAEPFYYLGIRRPMPKNPEEIGPKMGELFGKLMSFVAQANIQPIGMPLTVYYNIDSENIEMECGIPVGENTPVSGDEINLRKTGGTTVVKAIHMGDYHNLMSTYKEVVKYVEDNHLTGVGNPWEVYVTDPGQVPDTTQWITEVYYPVE